MSHERRSGDGRDRILSVARAQFSERGYDRVAVADIAAESGTSTGLIYYHFKDKQGLYQAAIREGIHLLEAAAVRALSPQVVPREKIRIFVLEYMRLLEDHAALMQLLIRSVAEVQGPALPQLVMRSAAIIDRLAAVIAEGIAAGVFREVDTHLAAAALFALINTLFTARALNSPLDSGEGGSIETQAAFMTDLFFGGIDSCS